MKLKIRKCKDCGRDTLQARERRQQVFAPDGEEIYDPYSAFDVWWCSACGARTMRRQVEQELTVTLVPPLTDAQKEALNG